MIDAGMTIIEERNEVVEISDPDHSMPSRFITSVGTFKDYTPATSSPALSTPTAARPWRTGKLLSP